MRNAVAMRTALAVAIIRVCIALLRTPAAAQTTDAAAAIGVSYGGGDGSSFATAIVINGAKNEFEGVGAEHAYVAKSHPDWTEGDSALLGREGRLFDLNSYRAADGSEHRLIFDVTNFFGKL
jgi:hypothetical protein